MTDLMENIVIAFFGLLIFVILFAGAVGLTLMILDLLGLLEPLKERIKERTQNEG